MEKHQFYFIKRIEDDLGSVTYLERFINLAEARKAANREHLPSKKVSKVIILKGTQTYEEIEEIDNPNYEGSNND